MRITDLSRYQIERPDPLNLAKAQVAGITAINIALDRGRSTDVLSPWARTYADTARSLGLGLCSYRWLDARQSGAEHARRALARIRELGGPNGMAHAVDCEDNADLPTLAAYVDAMQQALQRPIAVYTGRWWLRPRGWNVADLSPFLWAAPSAGYLGTYPGDTSGHWAVDYGGHTHLSLMQYAVAPLPGTGDCSLSAVRDPAVWAALTATPNPAAPGAAMPTKPAQVSDAMWWFVEQCLALTPTAWVDEYGGTYTDKPGSHNSRNRLIAKGLSSDYSIRDPLNKQGPGDKGAAFDWTFPTAHAGNYAEIVKYSARIKTAYEQRDPRTYPLFEVLCEADFDYDPEGYVFYPTRRTRVPDRTHKWHIHMGFIRKYLDDWQAFQDLFSLISGEPLATWKARRTTTSAAEGDDMTPEQDRMLYNLDRLNTALLTGADKVTKLRLQDGTFTELPLQLAKDVAAVKAQTVVDPKAVAAALTADVSFITTLAAAVAAQVTLQAGATADQVRKIVDEELDEQSIGGADKD